MSPTDGQVHYTTPHFLPHTLPQVFVGLHFHWPNMGALNTIVLLYGK